MDISGDSPLAFARRQTHKVLQAGRSVGLIKRGGAAPAAESGTELPSVQGEFLQKYGLWIAGGLAAFLVFNRTRA